MEELLTKFSGLLDNYARHREYINRARAQTSKFSSEIIEKVVLDHEIKSSSLADEILPFIPEIEGFITKIDTEKQDILSNKSSSDEAMQEIELRHLIGEIDDDEFNNLTGDLRSTLDDANGRLESLDSDRGTLSAAIERWVGLAADADQDPGLTPAEEAPEEEAPAAEEAAPEVEEPELEEPELEEPELEEPELEEIEEQEVMLDEPATSAEEALGDASFDPVAAEPDGSHSSFGSTEDLSVILDEDDHDNGDDEPIIATMEVDDDDDEADEFPFDDDEPAEVVLDPMDEDDGSHSIDDVAGIVVDFENVEVEPELQPVSDEPRRALLLYQEGTAEEQIYPFTGDVLTIGRGRDNDIQIKNDSKVSRFHCKLFRRSANFYIEDNKSSNGTLVNGELITERRLFGGEEVIIGETFFRFRIM